MASIWRLMMLTAALTAGYFVWNIATLYFLYFRSSRYLYRSGHPNPAYDLVPYASDLLVYRYGFSGEWWTSPLPPAIPTVLAFVVACLAGIIAGRFAPFGRVVPWPGRRSDDPALSRAWSAVKRRRHRVRVGTLLALLFIPGAVSIGMLAVETLIYHIRLERHWMSYGGIPTPYPDAPSTVLGWFTPLEGPAVLLVTFLLASRSVTVPARRVLRASRWYRRRICARCGYRLDPRPGTDATVCPECGHANPTLSEARPASDDRG